MSEKEQGKTLSRRSFLGKSAAAAGMAAVFPAIVPSSALGLDGTTAPSKRITLGFIGIGKMAKGHLGSFLGDRRVQVLGICDVEETRRVTQTEYANRVYARREEKDRYRSCEHYGDFRAICARQDIDAMVVATPNHWHAICTIEALRNGKDVYCEKPLARAVGESRAMVNAVERYGRVLQVGSQQRSDTAFRHACELVRNGYIGKIHTVHVNVGGPPEEDNLPAEPVPEGLDWDMWLGPCPWRPYSPTLAPPESYSGWPRWRYFRPYAGSGMTDFGAHHFDIAQWGLGMDDTGPVEVHYPDGEAYKLLTYVYANGVKMTHGGGFHRAAVEFKGDKGWVRVNRGQYLETEPAGLVHAAIKPGKTRLYNSPNHKNNWLECIRSRKDPICTAEIGHRTATVCHIGNIAYRLKRSLQWDPEKEEFVNDPEANRLLLFPMREPWRLT
jgi:predicted dehydrogenase